MIKAGDRFPHVKLVIAGEDGPREMTSAELFDGKLVVMFATPGAFTPTCSAKHLPGYVDNVEAFAAKGVDTIACLSVNDPFVMRAWAKDQGVAGRIVMIADGTGALTRQLGLELDLTARGIGIRSQRYAMIVRGGTIETLNVEPPGEFDGSKAETILSLLPTSPGQR